MKKKRLLCGVLVAALTVGALAFLQRLLVPKYQTGIIEGSLVEEYYKERLGHEVIFIGDCEVYENFSPITLWENYGITSYIRGSAQQLIWQSYYLLEDTLRYETPKVVVFNVLSLKYNEPQSEAYNRMSIDGMRWSAAKVGSIRASMTKDERFLDYVFPILRYHSRWSELTEDDWKHLFSKEPVSHSGYYMRVDVKPCTGFPSPKPLTDYTLGENAMDYLKKMTELCQKNGISLVLIKAPTEYPHWYEEWDAQVAEFAKENELAYFNYIPLQEEIGLDLSMDTYDAGLHLNTQGAEKLSDYFGAYLTKNYELADHRGEEAYEAVWKEKIDFYNEMKKQQFDELEKYGELKSFGANAIKNK